MERYIFSDLKRALCSWKFFISVVGVAATFFLFGGKPYEGYSIIEMYQFNIYQIQTLLVYIFCILPYGDAICQDMEYRFCQLMIIRGKIYFYSISKAISVFLTSLLTMVLGTALYIMVIRTQYYELAWVLEKYIQGAFNSLISYGMHIQYVILCSIQIGFLTGILSLICATASLYIVNRLFIFSLPVISYYALCYLSEVIFGDYGLHLIYYPIYIVFDNEWLSFLITFLVTCILFIIFTYIINKKLKWRLING